MLNLGAVLLELSKPFLNDKSKAALIREDTVFVTTPGCHHGAFPPLGEDLTPLNPAASATTAEDADVNFITQCFCLTWRALHLGLVSQLERHVEVMRRVHRIHHRSPDARNDPQLSQALQFQYGLQVCGLATTSACCPRETLLSKHHVLGLCLSCRQVSLHQPALLAGAMSFVGTASQWIVRLIRTRASADSLLPAMPEHFVDDLVSLTTHLSLHHKASLEGQSPHLECLFEAMVSLLSKPFLIHSPHLRAKLAKLIHEVRWWVSILACVWVATELGITGCLGCMG